MKLPKGKEARTIIFDSKKWTLTKARAWLKKKGFSVPKAVKKDDVISFTVTPPFKFKAGTTKKHVVSKSQGIRALVATPRKEKATKKKKVTEKNPVTKRKPAKKKNPEKKRIKIPTSLVYLGKAIHITLNNKKLTFPLRKSKSKNPAALLSDARGKNLYIIRYNPKDRSNVDAPKIHAALRKQWKAWSGYIDDKMFSFKNVDMYSPLTRIGTTDDIAYQWITDMASYVHPFDEPATVYANKRRTVLVIMSKNLRVTKRGIEG